MTSERAENKKKKGPSCPSCGNHLRLRPDQLGEQVMCPKCNAKFVVGKASDARARAANHSQGTRDVPTEPASKINAAVSPPMSPADALDDAYEPEIPLQRTYSVPESEMADISPLAARPAPYDVDWSLADDMEVESHEPPPPGVDEHYLEVAKRKGLLREPERTRPPKWTFFSGVLGYPWRGVNLSRWTAMGVGMSCAGMMAFAALSNLGLIPGAGGNAILGIFMSLFAVLMLLGSLSFSAASCEAAVADTADGFDEPQDSSLPDWDHWIFSLLAALGIWAFGSALGYPLSLVIGPVAFLIFGLLVFPVLYLSAMECGSYILPFSSPVLGSLLRRGGTWLMFYLLTTALIAAWVVCFDFVAGLSPYLAILLSGPIVATLALLYARWLGRVAWSISQSPDGERRVWRDGDDEAAPATAARSKRGKPPKKRRKIFIPNVDDLDAAPVETSVTQAPPPRLRFNRQD